MSDGADSKLCKLRLWSYIFHRTTFNTHHRVTKLFMMFWKYVTKKNIAGSTFQLMLLIYAFKIFKYQSQTQSLAHSETLLPSNGSMKQSEGKVLDITFTTHN